MDLVLYKKMYQLEEDNWWFRGRRKIFLSILDERKKNIGKGRILDVGCGTGIMIHYLTPYGKVEGLDISKEAINFCRARGFKNVYLGDAQNLLFSDNQFDLITAFDTVEHIKKDQKTLEEFYRVLKPGGSILITVPALPFIWSSHDIHHHHLRRYRMKDIKCKVLKANFILVKVTYINSLLFLPAFFFRLLTKWLNKIGIFKGHTDLIRMPKIINNFLADVFSLEAKFLRHVNFPLGITILIEAEKHNETEKS